MNQEKAQEAFDGMFPGTKEALEAILPEEKSETENKYEQVITRKVIDDDHWYWVPWAEKFMPSVTTILGEAMPTSKQLIDWIADMGTFRANEKRDRAGERGSLIHGLCEQLLFEGKVSIDEHDNGVKKAILSFRNWFADFQPVFTDRKYIEFTVASEMGFAGTLDLFCYLPEIVKEKTIESGTDKELEIEVLTHVPYIIDIKTSSSLHLSHYLQIVAYKKAFFEMTGIDAKIAILHLNKTKKGYSFKTDGFDIEKKEITIDDFMRVFEVYKMLHGGVIPEPREVDEYPAEISIDLIIEGQKVEEYIEELEGEK